MSWIGIDPGVTGGLAVIHPDGTAEVWSMKGLGLEERVSTVKRLVDSPHTILVGLEKAQAMPKQGVVSMFTYGTNYGEWLGILETLGLHYVIVRPQEWKKLVLVGTARDKLAALEYARTRFGAEVGKDHGRADALCIAEYVRRVYSNA